MARVYNFSAGPSQLPESVLRKAAGEMLEYQSSGQSVMEMSHRSPEYEEVIEGCESVLRQVAGIPDNYKVLFLQGGASLQFSMIPLNLLNGSGKADFVITGMWAKKAYQEAARFGMANVVASSADKNFSYIPKLDPKTFDPGADYFHICYNNTIYGTTFKAPPHTGDVPLVADMSSCFLSEPVDISQYGMIYAGAQKNLGPAGLTIVIIREDLIGNAREGTPAMLDYKIHADNDSLYNTPPTYAIYICKLVLEWLQNDIGGVKKMAAINQEKAALFYDYLDNSKVFSGTVVPEDRSLMNIPFVTGNADWDKEFLAQATKAGFMNLKGHRAVGGMRASMYNAMPIEGVQKLIDFMKTFEASR